MIKFENAGKFLLPQTKAIYADFSGDHHQVKSNVPEVNVLPSLVQTPETGSPIGTSPTPTIPKGEEKGVPGFEALIAIFALFIFFRVVRRK